MTTARELSQLAALITVDANNKITFASSSEVEFGGLGFPTTDGSNGQVLTTDGLGNVSFADASGGIADIVEDTTPQLGGNLDVNDKIIYNDTGTVKLQAGSADYVTIVNSSNVDKIRFSDIGGIAALGWYHQFGDSSSARGVVNLMGSNTGISGTGALRIHDGASVNYVELTVPTSLPGSGYTLTLPSAVGANSQVLATTNTGALFWANNLGSLSGDATPQLGGTLDTNGNEIEIASGSRIAAYSGNDISIYSYGAVGNAGNINLITAAEGGDRGNVIIDGIKHPNSDGSNGQVLTTDGSGNLSFTTISGGISNLVEDTTPQLGGNLDLNGNYIGDSTAYIKAYDFSTGSQFAVYMQGELSAALSIYANAGSSIANVSIKDDLTVSGGDITLGGTGRIQGIDTVSANTDAANKLYVDNAVAGAGGDFASSYVTAVLFG